MNELQLKDEDRVLILGATGFIGKRLVKAAIPEETSGPGVTGF